MLYRCNTTTFTNNRLWSPDETIEADKNPNELYFDEVKENKEPEAVVVVEKEPDTMSEMTKQLDDIDKIATLGLMNRFDLLKLAQELKIEEYKILKSKKNNELVELISNFYKGR